MTAEIMKANSEVMHRSTYRGLKEEENSNQDHILLRKEFDNSIRNNLGPDILPDNFPNVNLEDTPLCEMYKYDTTDVEVGLAGNTEDDEGPVMDNELDCNVLMPEVNDNYVNASVMFPRRNSYAKGEVIGRKRDADGNSV